MRRPPGQVREQVFVNAAMADIVAVLGTRDRAWLRALAKLAVGEAARDVSLGAGIVLGTGSADGDEWTWPVRLGSFRGVLVARLDSVGVCLSASGTAATMDLPRTRSRTTPEAAVRSLLGLVRNAIEERAVRE